jgi:hypothetical protein
MTITSRRHTIVILREGVVKKNENENGSVLSIDTNWDRSVLLISQTNPAGAGGLFLPPRCRAPFQLKAKHSALGETVTDSAYTVSACAATSKKGSVLTFDTNRD